ncbi:MAG: TIGR02757 family protein [Pseudomonadota bacterium]
MLSKKIHTYLEDVYVKYNRRHYVSPDPLQFLYGYEDMQDREIVALIASALAYGRVAQILKSLSIILKRLGPSPSYFITTSSPAMICKTFADFKHRFTSGNELSLLLIAIKRSIKKYGSLQDCFLSGRGVHDDTVVPALNAFVEKLTGSAAGLGSYTLPLPSRGSACKRLNLFLRWMIRCDAVDPGGWDCVPASKLVIPLDTHMFKIGRALGFTGRKQADLKAALEITEGFRRLSPHDPVRYDFALTRFGIRRDFDMQDFFTSIHALREQHTA